jgi:predicted NBD/HSP70 family sugar kinase
LIVLLNDGRDVPFKDLLEAEYQMVYMDSDNRMYALKEIARKARPNDE